MPRSRENYSVPDISQSGAGFTKRIRDPTLYDAVAGRVSTQRFIPDAPYTSTTRDTATSSSQPIPPDEVLFRRRGAPVRYVENDFYWADKYLKEEQILPDTDLLKAVHTYASDYYGRALGTQGDISFESMDETALLAVGILLEEAAKHVLGETGDLALVEGELVSDDEADPDLQDRRLGDRTQEKEHSDVPSSDLSKKKRGHLLSTTLSSIVMNQDGGVPQSYQAPKSLPPSAKQYLILTYLRSSLTAHTLKDLEKSLPSVASINGMQVKEYLQALSDDGKIHVEKIGSGNWYWSFASEETELRTSELAKLRAEMEGATKAVGELEGKVSAARAERAEGEEEGEREMLVMKKETLSNELITLKKELAGYADADPGEVERKVEEVKAFKAKAERWTDNLMLVEGYMIKLMGGDTSALDGLRRECYGKEYVEGEGLAEL